jgi:hypothetical protein
MWNCPPGTAPPAAKSMLGGRSVGLPVNVIVITGSRDPDTLKKCEGFGAYYVRKGPDFWDDLEAALADIHPGMASTIRQSDAHVPAPAAVRLEHFRPDIFQLARRSR